MAKTRSDFGRADSLDPAYELWLHYIQRRVGCRFSRSEPRTRAIEYVRALLSELDRKNSWQIARQAGEKRPDGMQRLLAAAHWDENLVRDDLRRLLVENLYDGNNLLIAMELGFIKKGNKSVGVHRQFSPETQRIENSQTGMFLLYTDGRQNFALVDRELYLPEEWVENHARCARAKVPSGLSHTTKLQLAMAMLERAIAAQVPTRGIVSDQMYGADQAMRERLERLRVPYILGIPEHQPLSLAQADRVVRVTAGQIAARTPSDVWLRLGPGAEPWAGIATSSWAWAPLHSEDESFNRWVLIRRTLNAPDPRGLRYHVCFEPREIHPTELIRRLAASEAVVAGFRGLQKRVGLDHYEVRLWRAWYRHVTLAMAAVGCVTLGDLHWDAHPSPHAIGSADRPNTQSRYLQ